MQELVGRLTALDPEASETLKVVSYFDTLLGGGVGIETLLRGAAVLSGTVAGHRAGSRVTRIAADGERVGDGTSAGSGASGWPSRASGAGSMVWIERLGEPHANDAMVLERLALAVSLTGARRAAGADGAVELAISSAAPVDERATAVARLRLDGRSVRAIAMPADVEVGPSSPTAVVATARGLARVVLVVVSVDGSDIRPGFVSRGRAGVGSAVSAEHLPTSWASALIALRLSGPERQVVVADDLGALLLIAEAADARADLHPDAVELDRLDPRARDILSAFESTGSVRAAAVRLGLHHSTVQARLEGLMGSLGYDPREPVGRTRLALAEALSALARPGLG